MRFLQKNKDQPEADLQAGSPRKKRRKHHAYAEAEDISAYFTSVLPTLAEQDSDIQAKDISRQRLPDSKRTQQERSLIAKHATPTIETGDKIPCSKLRTSEPSDKSESYLSWSESILIPGATPARLRPGTAREAGFTNARPSSQKGGLADGRARLHSRIAPTDHLAGARGEGFQISSLPPTNERVSRSHSLPQQISLPRHINLVDQETQHRAVNTVASPSSVPLEAMTHGNARCEYVHQSSIPEVPDTTDNPAETRLPDSLHRQYSGTMRETEQRARQKAERQRSSSLERILQACNAVFHSSQKDGALRSLVPQSPQAVSTQTAVNPNPAPYPVIRELPTVRFSGFNGVDYSAISTARTSNIYERQTRDQCGVRDLSVPSRGSLSPPCTAHERYLDDEALDYTETVWNEGVDPEIYGGAYLAIDERSTRVRNSDFTWETHTSSKIDAKPGFWRPHKLY